MVGVCVWGGTDKSSGRGEDRRGAIWMYVQHGCEHVCVCVCKGACVCVWRWGVSQRSGPSHCKVGGGSHTHGFTSTVFTGCTRAGGINTGSIPGSFASRLQDNLCLWVEKEKTGAGPTETHGGRGGGWSQYHVGNFSLGIKRTETPSSLHPKHFCVTWPDGRSSLLSCPRSRPWIKQEAPVPLVTAARCSTWQMCGRVYPSMVVFQVSFRVPLLFTVWGKTFHFLPPFLSLFETSGGSRRGQTQASLRIQFIWHRLSRLPSLAPRSASQKKTKNVQIQDGTPGS